MQAPKTFIVYDRRTDALICIGTSRECAAILRRSVKSVYADKSLTKKGKAEKYEVFDLDELAGEAE